MRGSWIPACPTLWSESRGPDPDMASLQLHGKLVLKVTRNPSIEDRNESQNNCSAIFIYILGTYFTWKCR